MTQLSFYLAAHAVFALVLAATAVRRAVGRDGGLAAWGNDSLYAGLAFVLALVIGTPLVG